MTLLTKNLEFTQWMPVPVEKVFAFFSDEKNLTLITPPWLHFSVLSKTTEQLCTGTLINYKLHYRKVPLRWQSLIEDWVPNVRFTDSQKIGPFALWRHLHTFHEKAGGTQMTDTIHYRLYGGWAGNLVAGPFIRRDIVSIFKYRKEVIDSIFTL